MHLYKLDAIYRDRASFGEPQLTSTDAVKGQQRIEYKGGQGIRIQYVGK